MKIPQKSRKPSNTFGQAENERSRNYVFLWPQIGLDPASNRGDELDVTSF